MTTPTTAMLRGAAMLAPAVLPAPFGPLVAALLERVDTDATEDGHDHRDGPGPCTAEICALSAAEAVASAILTAPRLDRAPAPERPVSPAVRPQDATEGGSESPAASEASPGPQAGAESLGQLFARLAVAFAGDSLCHCGIATPAECVTAAFGCGPNSRDHKPPATHPHHDHNGDEWAHPGRPEDCDLPDCAEPDGEAVPEHADLAGWYASRADGEPPTRQPAYDAVYAYIRTLGDHLPPDPVHRNAMIWRAVNAALDAAHGCPGEGQGCACGCEGCQHHCGAHRPPDEPDAPPLLARLTDVIGAGRAELHTDAEIAHDVWAEMGRGGDPGDGLRERLRQRIEARVALGVINQDRPFVEILLDAALAEVKPELDRLADYENRIAWDTACGEHARLLDACRTADERAERAEAAVDRVRAVHQEMASGDYRYCAVCTVDFGRLNAPWPCDTIRALDADTPAP